VYKSQVARIALAMHCGACCADAAAETLTFDGEAAKFDSSLVMIAKAFDHALPEKSSNQFNFLGRLGGAEAQVPFFKATIHLQERAHRSFQVDFCDSPFLRISKIEASGAVADYNSTVSASHRIEVGDFIVDVSHPGCEGGQPLSFRRVYFGEEGGEFRLSISRAKDVFVQALEKRGKPLGLDLTYQEMSYSVAVRQVMPAGLVESYNASVGQDVRIRKNDHIMSVCGASGSSRQLIKAMQENEVLSVQLTRPIIPGRGVH